MRRSMFIGGAVAVVIAAACSDSSTALERKTSSGEWSSAVIEVAASDPNAHGEIRGVVLDSGTRLDPSTSTPIPGATVYLNLKVTVAPGANGNDTAYTTVTRVGQVVTDANGRFLVTAIPVGDYYIMAVSPDASHYDNATWSFASTGTAEHDAVIYLPRILGSPPTDPVGTDTIPPGTGHPIDPPIDSVGPEPPPTTPPAPPVDSL